MLKKATLVPIFFLCIVTAVLGQQSWQYTEYKTIEGLGNITVRYDYWFSDWTINSKITDITIGTYKPQKVPVDKHRDFERYVAENGISFPMNLSKTEHDFGLTMTGSVARGFATEGFEKVHFSLLLSKGNSNWTSKEPSKQLKEIADNHKRLHKTDFFKLYSQLAVTEVKMVDYRFPSLLNNLQLLESKFLGDISNKARQFNSLIEQTNKSIDDNNFAEASKLLAQAEKLMDGNVQIAKFTETKNKLAHSKKDYEANNKKISTLLSRATSLVNAGDIQAAKALLAEAAALDTNDDHHQAIAAVEDKMASTAAAKEKEAEKEETTSKKSTAKGSSSGSAKSDSDRSETASSGSGTKSSSKQSVYVPKTATQKHAELKEMVARNPHMANDPKIRQQLRHLQVDANREQETYRQYRAGAYSHGNYQAMASQRRTEQRIDGYTKAVGDITDATTGLVNSIIAEGERKNEQRRAEIQAGINNFYAKKKALQNYYEGLRKQRISFEDAVQKQLEQYCEDVYSVQSTPIYYDTEVENLDTENPHDFKPAKQLLAYERAYIIKEGNQFGLAADNGQLIYPPQFDGIVQFSSRAEEGGRPHAHFLVNIEDKWGEITADGTIVEEIKHDGIWYRADYSKMKNIANVWELVNRNGQSYLETIGNIEKGLPRLQAVMHEIGNGMNYTHFFSTSFALLDMEKKSTREVTLYANRPGARAGSIRGYGLNPHEKILPNNYVGGLLFQYENNWYTHIAYKNDNVRQSFMQQNPVSFVHAVHNEYKKWGAINQTGSIIIPFEHDYLKDFNMGRAASNKGVYNEEGKLLFTKAYEYISDFDRGAALFLAKDKVGNLEIGLIDTDGKEFERIRAYSSDDIDKYWFRLGNHFAAEKNLNNSVALYCYGKVSEKSSDYPFANIFMGDIFNLTLKDEEQALKVYLNAIEVKDWNERYLKDMQKRSYSKRGSVSSTKYFNQVQQYHRLLYVTARILSTNEKFSNDRETAKSFLKSTIDVGNLIIAEFKDDFPPDRNQKPVDLSWIYLRSGLAFEHLGDLKQAKKYYKLSTARKTADVVKVATIRLKGLK